MINTSGKKRERPGVHLPFLITLTEELLKSNSSHQDGGAASRNDNPGFRQGILQPVSAML
jgi:hypothetical protein